MKNKNGNYGIWVKYSIHKELKYHPAFHIQKFQYSSSLNYAKLCKNAISIRGNRELKWNPLKSSIKPENSPADLR